MSDFEELFAKRAGHMRLGLERTSEALKVLRQTLAVPLESKVLTYLIGGTNGKGSTSGLLCQLFESLELRTAVYSSPHIVDYGERFFVPSQPVNHAEIHQTYRELKNNLLPDSLFKELSFFELSTLIAYLLFTKRDLDVAIFEVGLGGRLDSTNALEPHLSVITSIDFDHQEYLGDSLLSIATEKAAIRRPGHPLLWGEETSRWAPYEPLMRALSEEKQSLLFRGQHFSHTPTAVSCRLSEGAVTSSFALPARLQNGPEYLRRNMALAWAAFQAGLKFMNEDMGRSVSCDQTALGKSFAKTGIFPPSLTGRAQRLLWQPKDAGARTIYLDAAHNLAGIRELCQTLAKLRESGVTYEKAAVTILRDKAHPEMLDQLREQISEVLLFQVPGERSITTQDLADRHRDLVLFKSFATLVEFLKQNFDNGESILICGSIYGLGEVLRLIGPELRSGELT